MLQPFRVDSRPPTDSHLLPDKSTQASSDSTDMHSVSQQPKSSSLLPSDRAPSTFATPSAAFDAAVPDGNQYDRNSAHAFAASARHTHSQENNETEVEQAGANHPQQLASDQNLTSADSHSLPMSRTGSLPTNLDHASRQLETADQFVKEFLSRNSIEQDVSKLLDGVTWSDLKS